MSGSVSGLTREKMREAAEQIGRETGARLVVLFGSAADPARNRAEDVDLGILAGGRPDVTVLTNRFIQLLAVQHVDLVDLDRAEPVLLALAARDGVPLYEAEPGTFARFASLAARRFADTRKFREAERREIEDFVGGARRVK